MRFKDQVIKFYVVCKSYLRNRSGMKVVDQDTTISYNEQSEFSK